MSGIGELWKQSSAQLERYVVVLQSILRTTDLIDSLAGASKESDRTETLSFFFNGDKRSLISSCKANTKAILADAENLIRICKRAESEGVQETISERFRRIFKNSTKAARWVFNESYMKELINAATQHESSLFMAYSSLMLARNEIRQSDTQSTLQALTDTLTRQIQNFVESQKKYQKGDIDVLRSVVTVEQPESEVKWPSSLLRRGKQALSLGGGSHAGSSTTSLGADESIKNANIHSNHVCSEAGKQDLHTIAVIRNDGRMDLSLGNPAQGELAPGLFEEGADETPIETDFSHPNSPEQPGVAGSVAGISYIPSVKTPTDQTERVIGTETQVLGTPCDSATHQESANHGESSNNSLFSRHSPTATDDKSNCPADAQMTLSMDETIDTITPTLATGMVPFCVKTLTVHHDGSLSLILREPCRAEIDDCHHIILVSQFDIDPQTSSGIYSVSVHRGPGYNTSCPTPATIALSVLYGCRGEDTHIIIFESYSTQKQPISPRLSAQTVLVVLAPREGIPEGEGGETQTAPTGDKAPVYAAHQDDGIELPNYLSHEDSHQESATTATGTVFTAVPCECGHHTLVQDVDGGHDNRPSFMTKEVEYLCSLCQSPIRVRVYQPGLAAHGALGTVGWLAWKGFNYLTAQGSK